MWPIPMVLIQSVWLNLQCIYVRRNTLSASLFRAGIQSAHDVIFSHRQTPSRYLWNGGASRQGARSLGCGLWSDNALRSVCLLMPNGNFRLFVTPFKCVSSCDKHRVDQFSQEMARSANAKISTGFLNFSARLYNLS